MKSKKKINSEDFNDLIARLSFMASLICEYKPEDKENLLEEIYEASNPESYELRDDSPNRLSELEKQFTDDIIILARNNPELTRTPSIKKKLYDIFGDDSFLYNFLSS